VVRDSSSGFLFYLNLDQFKLLLTFKFKESLSQPGITGLSFRGTTFLIEGRLVLCSNILLSRPGVLPKAHTLLETSSLVNFFSPGSTADAEAKSELEFLLLRLDRWLYVKLWVVSVSKSIG